MRPIDADALSKRMYHDAFETDSDMQKWDSGCWIRYKMFENAIAEAPTITPERKTGKWIIISEFDDCRYAKCNQCKVTQVFYYNKPLTNFCPNCGADMGERHETENTD